MHGFAVSLGRASGLGDPHRLLQMLLAEVQALNLKHGIPTTQDWDSGRTQAQLSAAFGPWGRTLESRDWLDRVQTILLHPFFKVSGGCGLLPWIEGPPWCFLPENEAIVDHG